MADLAFDRYAAPKPTTYHHAVAHLLARRDPELWRYFASDATAQSAADAIRFELLKRTRRLDRVEASGLYAAAEEIAEAMGVKAPIALYRGEAAGRAGVTPRDVRNAALYFEADAAHILFEGDVIEALDEAEMRFLLGHELAHHALWTAERGRFWTAYRLLRWTAKEPNAAPPFGETARLERLYTEIYADRYGLWAVGDLEPALRAQAKLATGADEASGAAYLAEAEAALTQAIEAERRAARSVETGGGEPLAQAGGAAAKAGAPRAEAALREAPLRAVLLSAWAHDPGAAEGRARALLQGGAPLDRLDLVGQEAVDDLTHWLLYEFLTPPWSERDLVRAHAADISPRLADALAGPRHDPDDLDGLRTAINGASPSVKRYFSYLLLDFATVDPQIDDVMLAAALVFADDFGLTETFKDVVSLELKTTKTKLAEIERQATEIIARAEIALGAYSDAPPAAAAGDTR